MQQLPLIEELKSKGHRITKVREVLIDILTATNKPLNAIELLTLVSTKELKPNKTTIYRELDFLLKEGLIQTLDFGDYKKRYELRDKSHHHHLICIHCKEVEDFALHSDLDVQERTIKAEKSFIVVNHSLEFFGICKKCQNTR